MMRKIDTATSAAPASAANHYADHCLLSDSSSLNSNTTAFTTTINNSLDQLYDEYFNNSEQQTPTLQPTRFRDIRRNSFKHQVNCNSSDSNSRSSSFGNSNYQQANYKNVEATTNKPATQVNRTTTANEFEKFFSSTAHTFEADDCRQLPPTQYSHPATMLSRVDNTGVTEFHKHQREIVCTTNNCNNISITSKSKLFDENCNKQSECAPNQLTILPSASTKLLTTSNIDSTLSASNIDSEQTNKQNTRQSDHKLQHSQTKSTTQTSLLRQLPMRQQSCGDNFNCNLTSLSPCEMPPSSELKSCFDLEIQDCKVSNKPSSKTQPTNSSLNRDAIKKSDNGNQSCDRFCRNNQQIFLDRKDLPKVRGTCNGATKKLFEIGDNDNNGEVYDELNCDNRNELESSYDNDSDDECFDQDDDDETMSTVASAEEYATKILKLQQACLTPLKEDLADWLNRILNSTNMTVDNFMDKLDNGVILCKLAQIISFWCEDQLKQQNPNLTQKLLKSSSQLLLGNNKSSKQNDSTFQQVTPATTTNLYAQHRHQESSTLKQQTQQCNNNGTAAENEQLKLFMENLIRMSHIKIWEDARCRTFFARDNVCNFIEWSKQFGVNQSVLFESDDLVLHANPRQVVLCLLDVARIACVKHAFAEAPGLVKFEQEIERELAAEAAAAAAAASTTDACVASTGAANVDGDYRTPVPAKRRLPSVTTNGQKARQSAADELQENDDDKELQTADQCVHLAADINPGDSASCNATASKIPLGKNRTSNSPPNNSCVQYTTTSFDENDGDIGDDEDDDDDEIDASSSCISGGGGGKPKQFVSDLDGKVMKIAKSYYGKQANRGIMRLSEGKYKIADRIVFVRLLKGQHVMVRIGGGWDTLQNFLFRHKSNPSQVLDVEHVLPAEVKMMLEKNGPQLQAKQFTKQMSSPLRTALSVDQAVNSEDTARSSPASSAIFNAANNSNVAADNLIPLTFVKQPFDRTKLLHQTNNLTAIANHQQAACGKPAADDTCVESSHSSSSSSTSGITGESPTIDSQSTRSSNKSEAASGGKKYVASREYTCSEAALISNSSNIPSTPIKKHTSIRSNTSKLPIATPKTPLKNSLAMSASSSAIIGSASSLALCKSQTQLSLSPLKLKSHSQVPSVNPATRQPSLSAETIPRKQVPSSAASKISAAYKRKQSVAPHTDTATKTSTATDECLVEQQTSLHSQQSIGISKLTRLKSKQSMKAYKQQSLNEATSKTANKELDNDCSTTSVDRRASHSAFFKSSLSLNASSLNESAGYLSSKLASSSQTSSQRQLNMFKSQQQLSVDQSHQSNGSNHGPKFQQAAVARQNKLLLSRYPNYLKSSQHITSRRNVSTS